MRSSVIPFEFPLDRGGALNGIHRAGKFREQVIARSIHHASTVLLDLGRHDLAVRGECPNGRNLILAHQTAVAFTSA